MVACPKPPGASPHLAGVITQISKVAVVWEPPRNGKELGHPEMGSLACHGSRWLAFSYFEIVSHPRLKLVIGNRNFTKYVSLFG